MKKAVAWTVAGILGVVALAGLYMLNHTPTDTRKPINVAAY